MTVETQVKLSDVLNFVCTPLKIKETNLDISRDKAKAIIKSKLIFQRIEDFDVAYPKFIARVEALPPGTVFTIGSIIRFSSQGFSSFFGTKVAKLAHANELFVGIGTCSDVKNRYRRLDALPEKVKDTMVDIVD